MPIYFHAYELFQQLLFGEAVLTSHMELVLTFLATTAAIAVVAVPFWVVLTCIKFVGGLFS